MFFAKKDKVTPPDYLEAVKNATISMRIIAKGNRQELRAFMRLVNSNPLIAFDLLEIAGLVRHFAREDGSADIIYTDPDHPAVVMFRGMTAFHDNAFLDTTFKSTA